MAFASTLDAVEWCMDAQQALLRDVEWPAALLAHPGAAEEWDDIQERYGIPRCLVSVALQPTDSS
jgi:hypothetical protein